MQIQIQTQTQIQGARRFILGEGEESLKEARERLNRFSFIMILLIVMITMMVNYHVHPMIIMITEMMVDHMSFHQLYWKKYCYGT